MVILKRIAFALLCCLYAVSLSSQGGTVMPSPYQIALDNSGKIINNACIWVFIAGTTTPINTYTDQALSVANTNPIRSDPSGRFVAFLTPGSSYKFTYETACVPPAHGTVLKTVDNILSVPISGINTDVTGVAGQNITINQCVYLSDGSGAKAAGQWFVCDTTNDYSSTLPQIGFALGAITSGNTGTIRLAGRLTGLSALTTGNRYYVAASGSISALAPSGLARSVGVADATTSLVLGGTAVQIANWVDEFRLSLSNNTPVPPDTLAATSVFLTPYQGNKIDVPDAEGNGTPIRTYTGQLSIAIPATTSQMYDVFVYLSSGLPTLEVTAWTNDTTRASAISLNNGRMLKSSDLTREYLGSFRTTTVSGQSEDSIAKRYLWNMYNRVERSLLRQETTSSWNYTIASFRQANSSGLNQLDLVCGLAEDAVHVTAKTIFQNAVSGPTAYGQISIGEDSTTTVAAGTLYDISTEFTPGSFIPLTATLVKTPAIGRHTYVWLEFANAVGTGTFYGTSAGGTGITAQWRF